MKNNTTKKTFAYYMGDELFLITFKILHSVIQPISLQGLTALGFDQESLILMSLSALEDMKLYESE